MSQSTDINGIADADIATAGGRSHLVQFDRTSNRRIDLALPGNADVIGMQTNNDASAAGDTVNREVVDGFERSGHVVACLFASVQVDADRLAGNDAWQVGTAALERRNEAADHDVARARDVQAELAV